MESTRSSPSMDPVSDHEAARREILRGRALISQLRATLERSSSDRDTVDVLMEEISSSLTRALDSLNCNETRNLEASLNPNPSPSPNISNRGPSGRNRETD
ncbi:uncharacterized protein A4U43_C07F7030 [Asparagus officinalis]|uniref:Uncharacterized protein n=1 Tax=Asparagus officinalis TaxID=4686 RepID=A0A5P1EA14_ASPOF|nr:uncharacterized protein A4U43_C07F7030 [Asparagus officinalis]